MGLVQVQGLLAQLYTDAKLRERFFSDTHAVSEGYGLSPDEARQLSQISPTQVTFFADSLRRKRHNGIAKLLPLSARALGERFAELFTEFADTFVPSGANKQRQDARAFASFIEGIAQGRQMGPPWVIELLRYEAAELAASDPTSHCVIRWFREPISALVQRSADLQVPLQSSRHTLAIWFRLLPGRRPWHFTLSLPHV
ncbi:MAG TPA: hypothetical protein VHX16_13415 [Chloroflexota bacterium]|jgi:hypothetical protein|nr:hypothetical protein [Chloroflexota bacterium]